MFRLPVTIVAAATALAVAGFAAEASGAETVFRFNVWLPKNHNIHVDVIEPMAKEFEARTNGRATIEMTAASLGPPPTQFDMVGSGVADIAFTLHGYTPGRFPLTEIVALPFLGDDAEALSVAYWRVHEAHLDRGGEHSQVKLLALNTHGGGPIFTKAPITAIGDFSGVKMVVTNANVQKMAEALGAAAVLAPPPQWFELLSRGVAEGTLLSIDAPFKFKIAKFVPQLTQVPGGLYNQSFTLIMNKAKWDSLSPQDQQALSPLFGEALSRVVGKSYAASEEMALKAYPGEGVSIVQANDALVGDIRARLDVFEKAWIEAAAKKGVDGGAALGMLRAEAAKEQAKKM